MIKMITMGGNKFWKQTHDQVETSRVGGQELELSLEEKTSKMALESEEKESIWIKKMDELSEGDV